MLTGSRYSSDTHLIFIFQATRPVIPHLCSKSTKFLHDFSVFKVPNIENIHVYWYIILLHIEQR